MDHYYLNELNFDELNEYRKKEYRSLTLYKIIIKELSSEYTENQPTNPPTCDIFKKNKHLSPGKGEDYKVLSFLALGNNELPIDLRFLKKDRKEMLRLKINPVNKAIYLSTLHWNEAKKKFITKENDRKGRGSKNVYCDPAIVNLLSRIYIGVEDDFGFLFFPCHNKVR